MASVRQEVLYAGALSLCCRAWGGSVYVGVTVSVVFFVFFFIDTATTEIYTLSLHDVFRFGMRNVRGIVKGWG